MSAPKFEIVMAVAVLSLLIIGCAVQPAVQRAGNFYGYACYTFYDEAAFALPIPKPGADSQLVEIQFHGETLQALYRRDGMDQFWELEDGSHIRVGADFIARYQYLHFRCRKDSPRGTCTNWTNSASPCGKKGGRK